MCSHKGQKEQITCPAVWCPDSCLDNTDITWTRPDRTLSNLDGSAVIPKIITQTGPSGNVCDMCSILPVGRAGSMVGFSQELTCSQVNPLVPRETLYPQLLYDSSNVQPPEQEREGKDAYIYRWDTFPLREEVLGVWEMNLKLFLRQGGDPTTRNPLNNGKCSQLLGLKDTFLLNTRKPLLLF